MTKIINRLKEPSTYGGIAAMLASLGLLGLGEGEWNTVLGAVAAIAAAAAVFFKDPGSSE